MKFFFKTIVVLVALWIGGYGVFVANILLKTPQNIAQKTDAIVVVTGGNDRVKTGLDLLSQNLSDTLFISGVHESVTEADLRTLVPDNTLPACCIILGYQAKTTLQNAEEIQNWITAAQTDAREIRSFRLVTSRYHLDRAMLELSQSLHGVTIIPHPVTHHDDGIKTRKFWRLAFGEYNKIIYRVFQISYKAVLS